MVNNVRHRRVIAELATLDDAVLTPSTIEEFAEANRLRRAGFGNQIYDINTVIRVGDFEIEEIPMDPPDPDDPDGPPPVQLYNFRWLGRQITANIRVIALIITLITTSVGAAIKIIQAIKREHSPDEADTETTKEPTKTTNTETDTPTERPKRTKRH